MLVDDVMRSCKVSKITVYRWFRDGLVYHHRALDGKRVVDRTDLEQFLKKKGWKL